MTAALPMGSNKITGMADPSVSTDAATKAYVDALVAIFFSTGDIKPTLKSIPDSGWLMFDDGTFGSATSGSSNSNSAANLNLFTLLFNSPFTDANIPIFTSGGGATTRAAQVSASAAWAANCRMSLPKALGRAFGAAGAGSGLTARTLGQTLGEETHLLTLTELPTGIHSSGTGTATASGGRPNIAVTDGTISSGSVSGPGSNFPPVTSGSWAGVGSLAVALTATSDNTGGGAHNNIPPTSYVNWMVKQ
jgi:microcystin-dependent protein